MTPPSPRRTSIQAPGCQAPALLQELTVAPVPEPATMLLLGTGLAGLAVLKRRRRA